MKSMPRVCLVGLSLCIPARAESPSASTGSKAPAEESAPAQDEISPAPEESAHGAQEELSSCVESHEGAQLARLSGGLLRAREHLAECAMPACPEALRRDCSQWSLDLKALIPTIVLHVVGDEGDVEDAVVWIDGEVVKRRLDGLPVSLDPGSHLIHVDLPDGGGGERRIVVSEGVQGRRIEFDFRSSPPVPQPSEEPPAMMVVRPVPVLTYVLGGVAFVGTGLAVGMGFQALSMSREANKKCAPLCNDEVGRAVRERAVVSDIAWGVSAGAVIGAALVYLYRPSKLVPESPTEDLALDVTAGRGNARLTLGGTF